MFDTQDPPDDYKVFKKEVLETISDADVEIDESYELALFTVSRQSEGRVYYVEDLLEEFEEETEMEDIVGEYLPEIIKKDNSKFFAFVFPGFQIEEEEHGPELVCVLTGTLFDMDLTTSEIQRYENDIYASCGPWEAQDPTDYLNLTIPFRKAITYQNE